MSRAFVQASSQSLTLGSALLSAPPLTFACWFNPTTNNSQQALISLNTGGADTIDLTIDGTGHLILREFDGIVSSSGSAGVPSTGTWHHCAGTSSSHSNRTSYLDGSAGTTDTTTRAATFTSTAIASSLGGNFANGSIAFAAVWNVALAQQDISNLAAGLSPLVVRPDALVGYWPLWGDDSPEPDWNPSGTVHSLTLSNAPTKGTSNPPVIPEWALPGSPLTAAATGFSTGNSASFAATLSFTSAQPRFISSHGNQTLSFTSAIFRQFNRTLTGSLSFSGLLSRVNNLINKPGKAEAVFLTSDTTIRRLR